MKRYNPKEIEPRWQQKWQDDKIYEASDVSDKPKKYILEYFPYPSGAAMHVGHVRNYTIGDVMSRHARMAGFNVLHPMGWDSFGLPAENYAIKTGISPRQAIDENTGRFKQQLTQMGFGYDWSREIDSSKPDYYRWTQWFFQMLFKKGLAYQKESLQWWCPIDKTVLANEQVEAGKCWRCGSDVEKKSLKQWFFKITDYADRLEKDLDDLDWSDSLKSMQRNWIGHKTGINITYDVTNAKTEESVTVFTVHPDTNFGATFVVLAPEHPFVAKVIRQEIVPKEGPSHWQAVEHYVQKSLAKSEVERQEEGKLKTGAFTGLYVKNQLTGQDMPVWVSDFVLINFGTGAVVGVPAHDTRDFQFAQTFNIPMIEVVEPVTGTPQKDPEFRRSIVAIVRNPKTDELLSINWGKDNGGNLYVGGGREENEDIDAAARREITEETGYKNLKFVGKTGRIHHSYFAHSKNVARKIEAYGLLFDLIDDEKTDQALETDEAGKFSVEWLPQREAQSKITEELHALVYDLLVNGNCYTGKGVMVNSDFLNGMSNDEAKEKIKDYLEEHGMGKRVHSYHLRDWLISRQRYWGAPIPIIHCEKDGAVAVPEDQLPVVLPDMESYEPSGDGRSPLARAADWVNTTCPQCGGPAQRETDTMDGFACSSWYFLRFADPHNSEKAFADDKAKYWLPVDDYIGGAEHAVMHLLYARMWTKVMQDEGLIDFGEPFKALRNHGMILAPDGRKMSKSWGNVIAPDDIIDQGYGADSIRIMELFIGPWNQAANWSVEGMGGSFRFLQRVWALSQDFMTGVGTPADARDDSEIKRTIHRVIKKVSADVPAMGYNTAIAALMQAVNELYLLKVSVPFGAAPDTWRWAIESLLLLLAPFVPHITEELWSQLGHDSSIHTADWPKHDEQYLVSSTMTIAVQVNGKIRGQIETPADAQQDQIAEAAKQDQKVAAHLNGKEIKKVIYVPSKLISFVVQ